MKKKIGIITVYGENNFGNKLQNYASVKIYEELGLEVNTLRVIQSRMIMSKKEKIKVNLKKIARYFPGYGYLNNQFLKEDKFKQFSNERLNITELYNTSTINTNLLEQYEYLSVGSDQVWNDTDFNEDDMKYFSLFNVKNSKIIALSPSLGKTFLLDKNRYILQKALCNYSSISCREIEGAKYIESLTNQKCEVLVDPTMVIKVSDWINIEKKPNWLDEDRYALCYFLGGIERERSYIEKICKERKIKIIDILDKKNISYNTSPEEFIYLIHNAEVVFTDSFHACVFSIIFDRNFAVFDRNKQESKMNSRIETLFKMFMVENHKYGEIYNFKNIRNKEDVLYENRNKVLNFIRKSL